jgi:NAD+ diphosphatase
MRNAETVTFGGSGLDRAAEKRNETKMLWQDSAARVVVMWRGKPALRGAGLCMVAVTNPALDAMEETPLFLGMDAEGPLFAADISRWQPEILPEVSDVFTDLSEVRHPALPDGAVFRELRQVMATLSPREAELCATASAMFSWHRTHRFCARCGAGSEMEEGGWRRGCAACGGQHFPRTDPVVIMLITHGNDVLLGRSPGWPEGMYSLLAGFVEPGEPIEAAVRREVMEEAGVKVGAVRYLASQPWPFPNSLMFGMAGEAQSREIVLDDELEDAFWLSREDMLEVVAGHHPRIRPPRPGAIAGFLIRNWLADSLD